MKTYMTLSASHWYRILLHIPLVLACGTGFTMEQVSGSSEPRVYEVVEPSIESFLQAMVEEEHFTGVALVARKGEVIHAKGYGKATANAVNNIVTAFHVASITKQFTAAATMQLVEKDILDLYQSINAYLPEKYNTPTWDDVHVHHLLSHSSGITDYAVTRDYYDVVDGFCLGDTVDGMIREAMSKELEFTPGTKYSYSNIGFTLLGSIIENQTKTSYDRYMQDNILEPMGMRSSRIHAEGHVPTENEAAGYRWDDVQQQHVKDDVVSLPVTAPDGGLITTLSDFLRWMQLYTGGDQDILTQPSIDKMLTKQIGMKGGGPIDGYGYGIGVGPRFIGHSGYIVGFRSRFDYERQSGTLVVLFTNNTANNPAQISSGLLTILLSPES